MISLQISSTLFQSDKTPEKELQVGYLMSLDDAEDRVARNMT